LRTTVERPPRPDRGRHRAAARIAAVDPETARPLLRLLGLASITVSFLAASSAPTPLYAKSHDAAMPCSSSALCTLEQ
jgi:hypothetical protein